MKKIKSIQGLRGIACLMVFFSHAFGTWISGIEKEELIG